MQRLIAHVNRKQWWHVPPVDPYSYKKRGKFLASSFAEAEFWGRPLDQPQKVKVSNPLIGDEPTIETTLFGRPMSHEDISIPERWALDARMKKTAVTKGYDSILLMTIKAFSAFSRTGKLPRSMELNILDARPGTDFLNSTFARIPMSDSMAVIRSEGSGGESAA